MTAPKPKALMPIIHNDEPLFDGKNDHFVQQGLVEVIAKSLWERVDPPFVASLNGDWGQGKTSILKAIYKEITNEEPHEHTGKNHNSNYHNVRVIWFEAWRFQHDPTPIVALLNEIRTQLSKVSRYSSFFNKTKKISAIALESGLQTLANMASQIVPFASAEGLVDTIKRNGNDWEQRNHSYALPSQTIRDLLNKAIEDILINLTGKDKNNRLIIIIDDLDRCQPMVAYKLLEGLKIFLNLKSCVFLIGSNRAEIVRAISVGLRCESGSSGADLDLGDANEYFEKLCSYCWDIPFPTPKESADYVGHLLEKNKSILNASCRNKLLELLRQSELRVLPANPRRLKSFANVLIQLIQTGGNSETQMEANDEYAYLLSIAFIRAFLPLTYRHLLANPMSIRDINALSKIQFPHLSPASVEEMPEKNMNYPKRHHPLGRLALSPDDIKYAAPESCKINFETRSEDEDNSKKKPEEPLVRELFRMAPILALCNPPTDALIQKYLPHAAR